MMSFFLNGYLLLCNYYYYDLWVSTYTYSSNSTFYTIVRHNETQSVSYRLRICKYRYEKTLTIRVRLLFSLMSLDGVRKLHLCYMFIITIYDIFVSILLLCRYKRDVFRLTLVFTAVYDFYVWIFVSYILRHGNAEWTDNV